jgi:hypothetical protein
MLNSRKVGVASPGMLDAESCSELTAEVGICVRTRSACGRPRHRHPVTRVGGGGALLRLPLYPPLTLRACRPSLVWPMERVAGRCDGAVSSRRVAGRRAARPSPGQFLAATEHRRVGCGVACATLFSRVSPPAARRAAPCDMRCDGHGTFGSPLRSALCVVCRGAVCVRPPRPAARLAARSYYQVKNR